MDIHWRRFFAIGLIALSISACKGTDNSVSVTVDGHGQVSDGENTCIDQCTTELPLTWLQSQRMETRSVTYTATADFGYEFLGWTKKHAHDSASCLGDGPCTISIKVRCGEILDFRGGGIPCGDLLPMNRSVTAVFVEQGTIAIKVWRQTQSCVITTDDLIRCWGRDLENNVPLVTNPSELKIHSGLACVKDEYGLHCWGSEYYLGEDQPALNDPGDFTVNIGLVCAIDLGQVVCWGRNQDSVSTSPMLNNPTRITSSYENVCVIDEDGLYCWGDQSEEPQFAPIGSGTIQLPNYDCTITEDLFECKRFFSRPKTSENS